MLAGIEALYAEDDLRLCNASILRDILHRALGGKA